ncbi:hypothetical protein EKH55_4156 [Sinorhizobium alkalisoli]|nr:hypothetical protein EKH55_4156 [Sinorhizobium alkalisoli]
MRGVHGFDAPRKSGTNAEDDGGVRVATRRRPSDHGRSCLTTGCSRLYRRRR